jgi:hypothetical protein
LKKGRASPLVGTSSFGKPQFFLLKSKQLVSILPYISLYLQNFFPRIISRLDFSTDVLLQKWLSCFVNQNSFSITKFKVKSFLLCSLFHVTGCISKLLSTKNNKHTRQISTLRKKALRRQLLEEYPDGFFTSIGMSSISSFIDEAFTIEWRKLIFSDNVGFLDSKCEKIFRESFHFTILDLMFDPSLSDEALTDTKACLFLAFFRAPSTVGTVTLCLEGGKKKKQKFRKRFYIRVILNSNLIPLLPKKGVEFFDLNFKSSHFTPNAGLVLGNSKQYF